MTPKQKRKQVAEMLHRQRVLFRKLRREHEKRLRQAISGRPRYSVYHEIAEMDRHLRDIQREPPP